MPSLTISNVACGSSPRVRGKRPCQDHRNHASRLIPTCAGKTQARESGGCSTQAHPHVCGENTRVGHYSGVNHGSSPRVRGKRDHRGSYFQRPRLIPTCAGKTLAGHYQHPASAAHPHVCGENAIAAVIGIFVYGSSPRVRGKPTSWMARRPRVRLIPTCAGKTHSRLTGQFLHAAHPHVCGEN